MGRPNSDTSAGMPAELASTVNLMAHPLAGAAAMSAIGIGLASHAFGLWMGVVAGSLEAARRLSTPETGAVSADEFVQAEGSKPARGRARTSPDRSAAETASRRVRKLEPRRRAAAVEARDNLKSIPGIGPKLEQVLNRLGYHSYAQIAAMGAAEIGRLEAQLGLNGRIARDDWTGHAARLAGGAQ